MKSFQLNKPMSHFAVVYLSITFIYFLSMAALLFTHSIFPIPYVSYSSFNAGSLVPAVISVKFLSELVMFILPLSLALLGLTLGLRGGLKGMRENYVPIVIFCFLAGFRVFLYVKIILNNTGFAVDWSWC